MDRYHTLLEIQIVATDCTLQSDSKIFVSKLYSTILCQYPNPAV